MAEAEWEVDDILKEVVKKIARRLNIDVHTGQDLRVSRSLKQDYAAKNQSWTLFINRKGSLYHAVHKTGALMILESPVDMHDCFHEEYAMNYFINHIRAITKDMFTK